MTSKDVMISRFIGCEELSQKSQPTQLPEQLQQTRKKSVLCDEWTSYMHIYIYKDHPPPQKKIRGPDKNKYKGAQLHHIS